MALSTEQQMPAGQGLLNRRRSAGTAYVLWFFVGMFGGHRFYLSRTGSAAAQLILTILGMLTLVVEVGFVLLLAVGIWVLVDALLIPSMAEAHAQDRRHRPSTDFAMMAPAR